MAGSSEVGLQTETPPIGETLPLTVSRKYGGIPFFIFWSAPSWDNLNDWYKNHWEDLAARAPDWEVIFAAMLMPRSSFVIGARSGRKFVFPG